MRENTRDELMEIEQLLWIEKYYGLSKTIEDNLSHDKMEYAKNELLDNLNKYKEKLKIPDPIPRIKMTNSGNKVNFSFYDAHTGKRVLLGHWLLTKERDNG